MHTVWLIHWNPTEGEERARQLRRLGYSVDYVFDSTRLRQLRVTPPSAVVIDLSRIPSQGRDVAMALRSYRDTRIVPIVFVEGAPEKVAIIKKQLPDATYSKWNEIPTRLEQAIATASETAFVRRSPLEGYSGASLPKKLGIKKASHVCLINAPPWFEKTLSKLPEDVTIHRGSHAKADVAVWFVRSRKDLETRIKHLTFLASKGAFWIAWPKKASQESSDLSLNVVRKAGVDTGMMDFKVSSFDAVWSGLRFTSRRTKA